MRLDRLLRLAVRRELHLAPRVPRRRASLLRLLASGALALGFATNPVNAHWFFQQEVIRGLSSFDLGARTAPCLVDLDGDGDLDAVVGTGNRFHLLENVGTSSVPTFAAPIGAANPLFDVTDFSFDTPTLVDVDGDGDLDMAAGEPNGKVRYLRNTGSSTSPAFVYIAPSDSPFGGIDVGSFAWPDLADLDADGDLDLVVGERYGTLPYFENTGSPTSPAYVARTGAANPFATFDVGYNSSPRLTDLDSDGDLDAVVGELSQELVYLENTGSSNAPAFALRTGTANPFAGAAIGFYPAPDFADLDADGDLDLVVGTSIGTFVHLENTGSSSAPAFAGQPAPANPLSGVDLGQSSAPELLDLDGDLDLDLVVALGAANPRTFTNTGGTSAPAFVERTGAADPFASFDLDEADAAAFADLDGDGDAEVVFGGPAGTLRYLRNSGTTAIPAFVEVSGPASPFNTIDVGVDSKPELVDLDGDGDFDLAVADDYGTPFFFANTGTSSSPAFTARTGTANPLTNVFVSRDGSLAFFDLDEDGDLDVMSSSGGPPQAHFYFENTGTSGVPAFVEWSPSSTNPFYYFTIGDLNRPAVADLDGDFDLDVLSGQERGLLVYFASLRNDFFRDGFESGDTSAWSATVPP